MIDSDLDRMQLSLSKHGGKGRKVKFGIWEGRGNNSIFTVLSL